MDRLEKAKKFNQLFKANVDVTRKLIRQDELTPEELNEMKNIYDDWEEVEVGTILKEGHYYRYKNELYKVIIGKEHAKQLDWFPTKDSSLFETVMPEDVIPEWVQPGGHNPIKKGEKRIFEGKVYIALENTVYSPKDYAAHWEIVL